MKKILLIDDEEVILNLFRTLLKVEGRDYQMLEAKDAPTALALFQKDPADLVIIDICLPGGDGLDLLKELRKIKPQVKAVLTTAHTDEKTLRRIRDLHIEVLLRKPFRDMAEVLAAIDRGVGD